VSKVEGNEQLDSDILQSKADVLRARDVIPPYNNKPQQAERKEKKDESPPPAEVVDFPGKKEKTTGRGESNLEEVQGIGVPKKADLAASDSTGARDTTETARKRGEKTEIPQFDLAKELLARQRKVSSTRRKGPGGGSGPQERQPKPEAPEAIRQTYELAEAIEPQPEWIIAEIVAGDIERLRRNDNH